MLKDKSASGALFRGVSALILACFLAHAVDCYRLKKADRRKHAPEGFRRGKIVFGKVPQGKPVFDGEVKANISVEDGAAYQADSAGGWGLTPVPVQQQQPTSLEASWRRLTSLQCGDNHMKLSVKTPGLSHLSVLQAPNAAPLPLPLVPLNCGYNMHRNSLGLLMYVPYGGCYILQQAGSYVLPMHWQGVPVNLVCTKHAPTEAPKPTMLLAPSDPVATKGPTVSQVPKWLAVSKTPGSPVIIGSQHEPRSHVHFPSLSPRSKSGQPNPRVQSPYVPYFPQWPPAMQSQASHPGLQKPMVLPNPASHPGLQKPMVLPNPASHPGLQKHSVLQDHLFNFKLPPLQNPYVSQYPVMPHMPYAHNVPHQYQVPQAMPQYQFFNPYLWPFQGYQPRARNPSQKQATLSNLPHLPPPSIAPIQTTTKALTTTAAPAPETTPLLPYNQLFQFSPELMHYISYEDLLAAIYANQQK
ncbi:uncharacterized protein LOC133510984 [Syngnathoides biaculeatus]|uniref:uncharacterized protein LOC133510984 n=1 Tax=Syngnathoides biaculeatus TaxID=300417 RepID=UPI002ADDB9C2|nr:uncharacterized protein LOC133510984 [Syngnathoides biaculeatus]